MVVSLRVRTQCKAVAIRERNAGRGQIKRPSADDIGKRAIYNRRRKLTLGSNIGRSDLIAASMQAQAAVAAVVDYQTMANTTIQLRAFPGRSMALLIDPARQVDQGAIERILATFDRAWAWYSQYFGRV